MALLPFNTAQLQLVHHEGKRFLLPVNTAELIAAAVDHWMAAYLDDVSPQYRNFKALHDAAMTRLSEVDKVAVRAGISASLIKATHFVSGAPMREAKRRPRQICQAEFA